MSRLSGCVPGTLSAPSPALVMPAVVDRRCVCIHFTYPGGFVAPWSDDPHCTLATASVVGSTFGRTRVGDSKKWVCVGGGRGAGGDGPGGGGLRGGEGGEKEGEGGGVLVV